jgi:hypothetical protein
LIHPVEQCLNNKDILVIQEHWLYPDSISIIQTFHQNFAGWGRCSRKLDLNSVWRRGKGGIAIFLRKSLNVSGKNWSESFSGIAHHVYQHEMFQMKWSTLKK